jgi:hypothetical protein
MAIAVFHSSKPLMRAVLILTTDKGFTGTRKWVVVPATTASGGGGTMASDHPASRVDRLVHQCLSRPADAHFRLPGKQMIRPLLSLLLASLNLGITKPPCRTRVPDAWRHHLDPQCRRQPTWQYLDPQV